MLSCAGCTAARVSSRDQYFIHWLFYIPAATQALSYVQSARRMNRTRSILIMHTITAHVACLLHSPPSSCVCCSVLQVVNGACCTSGQPTYSSHDIFVPSSGLPLSYLTCSDGPCSGDNNGVSFDYRTVSSSFESAKPLQCCDAQNLTPDGAQQGNTGSYYNPQQTSGLNWLPSFGYKFNGNKPIPGTGRPCDSSLPVVTCGIRGEVSHMPGCTKLTAYKHKLT